MFKKLILATALLSVSVSSMAQRNPQITHPSDDCVTISTFPDVKSTAKYLRVKIKNDLHNSEKAKSIDGLTDEQIVRTGFILYCGFSGE